MCFFLSDDDDDDNVGVAERFLAGRIAAGSLVFLARQHFAIRLLVLVALAPSKLQQQ